MSPFVIFFGLSVAAGASLAARHCCASFMRDALPPTDPEPEPQPTENRTSAESSLRRLGALISVPLRKEREIRAALAQAGVGMDAFTWIGIEIVSVLGFCTLAVAALVALSPPPGFVILVLALAIFLGYALPQMLLSAKKRKREKEINAALPSALELLSTTVHAGYPLERGIRLIGAKTHGELAKEFRRVDREINYLNMPLDKALERMKERCATPNVTYFANAMIQSYKQGTSVARSLETQAQAARSQYYSEVLVKINQLPSKMVPIIFVVFLPIIVALSVAPVVYNTMVQFANLM